MFGRPGVEAGEQRFVWRDIPGAALVGGGLLAVGLLVVWWGRAESGLMPVTGMLAVVASVIDGRTLRIPNLLTLSAFVVQACVAGVLIATSELSWRPVVGGMLVMGAPLLVSNLWSAGRTPGLGDVKLAGVLGMAAGAVSVRAAYAALLGALMLGALVGLGYRVRTGSRSFPLGPAISAASVIAVTVVGLSRHGGG
jgi:leader peptidase (prepilin peptidase)/N-methyltransferase